jgi:hypothetical protein
MLMSILCFPGLCLFGLLRPFLPIFTLLNFAAQKKSAKAGGGGDAFTFPSSFSYKMTTSASTGMWALFRIAFRGTVAPD